MVVSRALRKTTLTENRNIKRSSSSFMPNGFDCWKLLQENYVASL